MALFVVQWPIFGRFSPNLDLRRPKCCEDHTRPFLGPLSGHFSGENTLFFREKYLIFPVILTLIRGHHLLPCVPSPAPESESDPEPDPVLDHDPDAGPESNPGPDPRPGTEPEHGPARGSDPAPGPDDDPIRYASSGRLNAFWALG